ncbi:hypothetical protein [Rhizobium phage RHEph12]|nr:hypothetical protein [Rhizobium phage RHEph12]
MPISKAGLQKVLSTLNAPQMSVFVDVFMVSNPEAFGKQWDSIAAVRAYNPAIVFDATIDCMPVSDIIDGKFIAVAETSSKVSPGYHNEVTGYSIYQIDSNGVPVRMGNVKCFASLDAALEMLNIIHKINNGTFGE